MPKRFYRIALLGVLAACVDHVMPLPEGTISLTAEQATALNQKLELLVANDQELGWLADSANLVLREGALVDTFPITTSLGSGPYYGIALQRAVRTNIDGFSTFHAIFFNDPSNVTDFIIVSGFAGSAAGPPESVSGSFVQSGFGLTSLNAHFFHAEGTAVTHWRATAGNAALSNVGPPGSCRELTPPAGVTCETSPMSVAAIVTSSARERGSAAGLPIATVPTMTLRGIRLKFSPQ